MKEKVRSLKYRFLIEPVVTDCMVQHLTEEELYGRGQFKCKEDYGDNKRWFMKTGIFVLFGDIFPVLITVPAT